MSMQFTNVRFLLTLRTPVVLTAFAPTLDGLLYEALVQRSPWKSPEQILSDLKSILCYNEKLGVFHASSLKFGVNRKHGLIAKHYHRADRQTEEKISASMFSATGINGKYKKMQFSGGATKTRMTSRPAYSAPFACFDACGDAHAIRTLLKHTFVGIGYDAQNCGMGEFDTNTIEIIPLSSDLSLMQDGEAMRPLPATSNAQGVACIARMLPPYYLESGRQHAISPPRVQMINTETF